MIQVEQRGDGRWRLGLTTSGANNNELNQRLFAPMQEGATGTVGQAAHGYGVVREWFGVERGAQVVFAEQKLDEQSEEQINNVGLVAVSDKIHP